MNTIIYKFKKGEIVHLDSFCDVSAFVFKEGYSEPYKNEFLAIWNAETSDEHKILKNFVIKITIK